jgi:hypothetical protein
MYVDSTYQVYQSDAVGSTRMFIQGITNTSIGETYVGIGDCDNKPVGRLEACWTIEQLDAPLIAETEAKDVDDQIFYEVGKTYPIENRLHKVLWRYEDYTEPGTVFGSAIFDGVDYSNKTIIGLTNPATDETGFNNEPHYFQAGDTVYILPEDTATSVFPEGSYEILYVIDSYNIIVDYAFSSGPTVGGGVYLYNASDSVSGFEEADQTTTQPARIRLNFPQNENSVYNAYAFGNGLESDRIRDDFNETELQYSPRASTVIDDYKQEIKEASLCYSGIYKGDSSVNRLNEFNLSKANFKNLDREFGSIQKIFARDTDLLVLQENKTSKVLYGKNLLSDSVGGGQISSVPEVLGTQIAYAGDYGISFNPESFAEWGNAIWWCDERRGAVLQMTAGQIVDISKYGMKDFFRDMYRDNPRTQKLGVYDPYRHHYVLASNEDTSVACSLSLSKEGQTYPAYKPGGNTISTIPTFYVYSNTSWTTGIVYSAGSGWVTGLPASGYGDQAIYLGIADNNSGAQRTATITFTYCSGATATFTITQSRAGGGVAVISWVGYNGKFTRF